MNDEVKLGGRRRVCRFVVRHSARIVLLAAVLAPLAPAVGQDEPPPPPGPSVEEPPPPPGPGADEPPPPSGPGSPDEPPPPPGPQPTATTRPAQPPRPFTELLGLTGFWEVRGGVRTQDDPYQKDASLGETRLHLDWEHNVERVTLKLSADLLYDAVADDCSVDLNTGEGCFDLRQANVTFTPASFLDVKVGRQILTWGTGDLIFINDLFPKDWQSFLTGRDVEYLKAPSDALKLSLFSDLANVDLVYVPQFDPDRFVRGERLSYYGFMAQRTVGRDAVVDPRVPDTWFKNGEWHLRLSKNIQGYELAAYGYWGYWKSPGGMAPLAGKAVFPRLSVYGASARGQVGRGIGNIEVGYYDSRQDRGGDNPFINNSQFRFLVGYEQDLPELARDLSVGVQYYLEWMVDYDDYLRTFLPGGFPRADERRHVLTFRLTKLLLNQTLVLSLFAYYSPSDSDAYLRPAVTYKLSDHWTAELGGNVFIGKDDHTFFGQFDRNSNVYTALRYSF